MNTLTVPIHERDHLRGSPDAPVVLVEYGDFECPYCGAVYAVLKKLEKDLPDTLAVVFRQFPLVNVHPHAQLAAEASEAAGAQGKFWRMHDLLFEHQDALAPADLVRYGTALHLDLKRFAGDLSAHLFLPKIQGDMEGGLQSGVRGTPTFFINGVLHKGGYDEASLRAAILQVAAAAS
jgi:protein-disulfide isomerase